jgi:hypothetical protein
MAHSRLAGHHGLEAISGWHRGSPQVACRPKIPPCRSIEGSVRNGESAEALPHGRSHPRLHAASCGAIPAEPIETGCRCIVAMRFLRSWSCEASPICSRLRSVRHPTTRSKPDTCRYRPLRLRGRKQFLHRVLPLLAVMPSEPDPCRWSTPARAAVTASGRHSPFA